MCLGSHCDCSLLKTLLCLVYSWGIFVLSVSWAVPMIALQSRIWSALVGHGLLTVRGMNCALAVSKALNMMGSCVCSLYPLLQPFLGFIARNPGFPVRA